MDIFSPKWSIWEQWRLASWKPTFYATVVQLLGSRTQRCNTRKRCAKQIQLAKCFSGSVPGRFRGNGLQDGVVIQADPQHCDLVILIASYRNEPKEFPQNPHITIRCFTRWIQLSWYMVWQPYLKSNQQYLVTCLEVAAPCYNVQNSLMSRLHPLSRDTPKAPRYPRRSISTPQWGINWHPGTWSRRFFEDYCMHACDVHLLLYLHVG